MYNFCFEIFLKKSVKVLALLFLALNIGGCSGNVTELDFAGRDTLNEKTQSEYLMLEKMSVDTLENAAVVLVDSANILGIRYNKKEAKSNNAQTKYFFSHLNIRSKKWEIDDTIKLMGYIHDYISVNSSLEYVITSNNFYVKKKGLKIDSLFGKQGFYYYEYIPIFDKEHRSLYLLSPVDSSWKLLKIVDGSIVNKFDLGPLQLSESSLPYSLNPSERNYRIASINKDTIYLYDHQGVGPFGTPSLTNDPNDRLLKIDTFGKLVGDKYCLIPFKASLLIPLNLFVNDKSYILTNIDNDKYTQYVSLDYGQTWKQNLLPDHRQAIGFKYYSTNNYFLFKYLPHDILMDRNFKISISSNYGKDWTSLNEYISLENNTFSGKIKLIECTNDLYIEVIDTTNLNYLYRAKLLPRDSFSSLKSYSVRESPDAIEITVNIHKTATQIPSLYSLELFGKSTVFADNNLDKISVSKKIRYKNDSTCILSFNPEKIGIAPGKKYNLYLKFFDHTKPESVLLKERIFTPISFFEQHAGILKWALPISLILLSLLILLIVSPYTIYIVYTKISFLRKLAEVTGGAGKIFIVIDKLTFIPFFVKHPNVADAWVKRNQFKLQKAFYENNTVRDHQIFVPLPIRIGSITGQEITVPSPKTMEFYLKPDRLCIEIIGSGGAGKTTLATAIASWLSKKENVKYFKNHLWLPIIIEEEIKDLFLVIKGIIRSFTAEEIEDDFLKFLLKKQRLVILIDAISERSIKEQDYIQTIYSEYDINALIITSRRPLNIQTSESLLLFPMEMDSLKVHQYIKEFIQNKSIELFSPDIIQANLLQRILKIFNINNELLPIKPILVSCFMKSALAIAEDKSNNEDIDTILDKLPSSIPAVYIDYLMSVNPKTEQNPYTDESVVFFSELIAEICLGDDFTPKDVSKSLVMKQIKMLRPEEDGKILNRLNDNGILDIRFYGTDTFIRFVLDPLAEFLCAFSKAKKCGKDEDEWVKLYSEIIKKNAVEFLKMLEIIQNLFANRYGWWVKGD